MPDTETRIAEIRDRLQDATKGTWGTYYDGAVYYLGADMRVDNSCGRQIGEIPDGEDKMQAFHDAMFIGRARDDVQFLLDRIAELEEVVDLRAMLADREREIAELKAAEPTLDDDQPAAPR